ncbi:MAG: hypothetical protein RI883_1248 [Bacteroidota bacterium]|jgi:hypothetical protein
MNKEKLQEKIIENQKLLVSELKEKIDSSLSMVDIDETDTIDPEDLSHQSESLEMKNLFEQKLVKAQIELDALLHMDFSAKNEASPGALVSTEKFHFLIGFAAIPFEFEGKRIVGISIDSPIYSSIKGKVVGDSFSYSDNNYKISEIR